MTILGTLDNFRCVLFDLGKNPYNFHSCEKLPVEIIEEFYGTPIAYIPIMIIKTVKSIEQAERLIADMLALGYNYLGLHHGEFEVVGIIELAFSK